MVIGLGGESVLETDITLHHLYGIPFIPASALKGLTRAYITGEVEGYRSDKIDNDNEEVKRIFGSQEHAGTVIFFDAMPTNGKVAFVLDIMNPHYPEYYAGNKPPTNDQNPVPVTFLTVTNTTFTFALAPRDASKEQHVKDLEQVKTWLARGIAEVRRWRQDERRLRLLQKRDAICRASTIRKSTGASSSDRGTIQAHRTHTT